MKHRIRELIWVLGLVWAHGISGAESNPDKREITLHIYY